MTTLCTDEVLPLELREATAPSRVASPDRSRTGQGPVPAPQRRRRYEDFEARTSEVGDLLGGRIFPRLL